MNDWAKSIIGGIERYKQQVILFIEDGFYEIAGMEIGNSIFELEEGYKNMPAGTVRTYTFGLLARFNLFRDYCLNESLTEEKKGDKIKVAMNSIEERINLVEISANSMLKRS